MRVKGLRTCACAMSVCENMCVILERACVSDRTLVWTHKRFKRTLSIYYDIDTIAGIAHWLERQTRDRKVPGSSSGRSGGRIFFSRINFLCWLLFQYAFHHPVTAVARKRSRSFCQKCRWQVTAKHTYTLPMWLWMKWHCKLVHGWMYTELAPRRQHFTWHQPCNNQRAISVHHFRGY